MQRILLMLTGIVSQRIKISCLRFFMGISSVLGNLNLILIRNLTNVTGEISFCDMRSRRVRRYILAKLKNTLVTKVPQDATICFDE